MNIYALCSWYDEQPEHLRRLVTSLKGFADVIVAADGVYSTFEHTVPYSPAIQHWALSDAARTSGLRYELYSPSRAWASEVEKRATLFEYARDAGATSDDWLLIMDADMALGEYTSDTRAWLEDTDRDVAEVRFRNMQIDGGIAGEYRFRSMFRALPGLTVERAHYLYTVPCNQCENLRCRAACGSGRRFLWHQPNGQLADEPILDLFGHVTLNHYNSQRDPIRKRRALDYYKARDAAGLEAVGGDWTGNTSTL